ncbi:MAG: hypothetical protein ACJ8F7_03370 [Gemmataceae bacterium]
MTPFAIAAEHFGQTIINVLAVAGSAAVGYFLTYGIVWVVCRLAVHKPPPRGGAKIVSLMGGIVCALAVAMLLFKGDGSGGGWGFGNGLGFGKGPGSTTQQTTSVTSTEPSRTARTEQDTIPKGAQLTVYMVGGYQPEKRFYRLENGALLDFDGLKDAILERLAPSYVPKLREIVIVIDPNTVSQDHYTVKQLQEYAKSQDLIPTVQDRTKK